MSARLGGGAGIIACVGRDDFGTINLERLKRDGVDISAVSFSDRYPTGSAFVRYRPDGGRDFVYNIAESAAGRITLTNEARRLADGAGHLHVMGSALSIAGLKEIVAYAATAVRARGGSTSFDPNVRKELIDLDGGLFAALVDDADLLASNFRSEQSLSDYLKAQGVVAISGIDTRKLTRILREKGAQNGCILAGTDDEAKALGLARSFPGLAGMDLAKVVSTDQPHEWTQTEWRLGSGYGKQEAPKFRVVAFDYGVKYNILRMLAERGCHVTVLPAKSTAADALALNPDGIFLSNGPGDPEPCDYAIAATREFIERGIPTFGICLGHQIMGLAVGAKTMKMKTGHHGANHPVKDLDDGRVVITSQNHGFAVDADTLPANAKVTHVSLFDGTLQGFARTDKPAFCFQGHPEEPSAPHISSKRAGRSRFPPAATM